MGLQEVWVRGCRRSAYEVVGGLGMRLQEVWVWVCRRSGYEVAWGTQTAVLSIIN